MSRTGKIPEGPSRGELRELLPEFSSPGSIAYDKKRIWVADIEIGEILEWAGLFFPLNRSQGPELVAMCQVPRPVQLCGVTRRQAVARLLWPGGSRYPQTKFLDAETSEGGYRWVK